MANKNDIRYRTTETAIREAFLKLASGQDIKGISATKLCEVAGISRNAFYLHYSSVAELYSTMIDEIVADVRARSLESAEKVLEAEIQDATLSAAIIEALSCHEELLRTSLDSDTGTLACRLADGIAGAYIDAALKFGEHGGSIGHQLSCSFSAWGLIGMVIRWISETDRSIADVLPYYDAAQVGISADATEYLLKR